MANWEDRAETRIYNQQYDLIKRRFGKQAAQNANYGWGVDSSDDCVSIATKVYSHGVLTSTKLRGRGVRTEHQYEGNL